MDIARRDRVRQIAAMFTFDRWGDWAQTQVAVLVEDGVAAVFKDGRQKTELASNPSYFVEIETANRLGSIGFWKNGLCDIEVIDTTTAAYVDSAAMLEATDETVPDLFKRFVVAFGFTPHSSGNLPRTT